jgi:hypothetical protein
MNFDNIRPFHDDELPAAFDELLADPMFCQILTYLFPDVSLEAQAARMRACRTKLDFQLAFGYDFLQRVVKLSTNGVTLSYYDGFKEDMKAGKAATFMSNHRDIVLDSGFLDLMLVDEGLDTVEIAIGDNLLVYPWIRTLVRINKSFIVQRGLPMRQFLEASKQLSAYIHYTLSEHHSIWIAQREGRAKDNNDQTQESLLKMLGMAGGDTLYERLCSLNITPLSISYEYDPCDYLKAEELELKYVNPDYKKSQADDLLSMQTGITGYKGKVAFCIGTPINHTILEDEDLSPTFKSFDNARLIEDVATIINDDIHSQYTLFKSNYMAADYFTSAKPFSAHYTNEEFDNFKEYMTTQIGRILERHPELDQQNLLVRLLQQYAYPVYNQYRTELMVIPAATLNKLLK